MAERPLLHTVAVGLSWRTASADLRDRCHIPAEEIPPLLARLREAGIEEALVLSTCNRIEIWMGASRPQEAADCAIEAWERSREPGAGWREALHVHLHEAGAEHVFRVASSLESLVLGETQIPSQVRMAWDVARREGACGWFLGRLLQGAMAASKKVRNCTRLGEGATSIAGAAVDLARKVVGRMDRLVVGVVGAGEMAELAATGFVRAGATRFVWVNRTLENSARLQRVHPGRLEPLEALDRVLEECDVLVSATAAPGFVVRTESVQRAMQRRRSPLFLLDIAAPRDIEPTCARLDGVFLFGIDDLEQVVDRTRRSRGEEACAAEGILGDEARAFCDWVRQLAVIPLLSQVRSSVHETARAEVDRFLPRLVRTSNPAEAKMVLEDFAQALANKFLHQPTTGARRAAAEGREPEIAAALRDLFLPESQP